MTKKAREIKNEVTAIKKRLDLRGASMNFVSINEFEKKCVVIELTVPAEENLAQANNRKKCKYADLIHECQEAGWDVRYFPVEVGSRGFTNQTLRACFKYLDLSNKEIRLAIDEISKTALRATYTIWLARSNKMFGSWELVERPVVPTVRQLECEGPRGQSA